MTALLRRGASLAAVLGFVVSATASGRASGFQFSPVRVNLTARERASTVTLTNLDDAPLRVEVQAFRWTQRVDGQQSLDPSDALLVFPQLLTIAPHGQGRLRVTMTDPPGAQEASYKVAITEIGSFATARFGGAGVGLRLQTNLPVFIAPAVERLSAAIADASVRRQTLTFAVINTGTLHFVSKDVRVIGLGSDTRPLFSQDLDGGDVLADGKREYHVTLAPKQCEALRAMTIQLSADDQHLIQTLDVPAGACAP